MSCAALSMDGPSGIADALRSVDCHAKQATAFAFDRLFGAHGALSLALGLVLTVYVALLAVNLLTGRTTLRLSLLTPRALTLGLVLTFATSWAAYQQVVWNLAEGAPDEIARLVLGVDGSSSDFFASRVDRVFAAVADAATAAAPAAETAAAGQGSSRPATFSASDVLWLSGCLLLLGTAGVQIVVKLTLAALLAIGPVFVVLALFDATRGLFLGWLRSVVLFAVAPLVTVLVGGGALMLMAPMVEGLAAAGAAPTMRSAVGLLLAACIYCALMALCLKTATVLVGGWQLGGSAGGDRSHERAVAEPSLGSFAGMTSRLDAAPRRVEPPGATDDRIRQIVAASRAGTAVGATPAPLGTLAAQRVAGIVSSAGTARPAAAVAPNGAPSPPSDRSRGLVARLPVRRSPSLDTPT